MENQQPATSERVNPAPLKAFQTDDWTAYFGAEVGGATLTADPSCAVHQNLLVSEQLKVLVHVVWEVAELTDIWRQALSELPLKAKNQQLLIVTAFAHYSIIAQPQYHCFWLKYWGLWNWSQSCFSVWIQTHYFQLQISVFCPSLLFAHGSLCAQKTTKMIRLQLNEVNNLLKKTNLLLTILLS